MDESSTTERPTTYQIPLDRRKSNSTADGDHGDTCRICRGEGTTEQPLFYPCKCSGSIKFVHQDCLMQWLAHSQKKYCELCKTPFRFTKLYDKSMPDTLPLPLFLRQVAVHTIRTFGRWLRYVLVTLIWTCWLPWSIRQIWRGLFWLADGSWMSAQELKQFASTDVATAVVDNLHNGTKIADSVSESLAFMSLDPIENLFSFFIGAPMLKGLLRLLASKPVAATSSTNTSNSTGRFPFLSTSTRQPSLLSNVSSLNALTNSPVINHGFIDILEGQLVCLSIIAAFILVFLIREWVINQQPILNMPNPEQAEVQPVPVPLDDDAPQPGRRRRRGFRRFPDQDGLGDNLALELAPRPVATPRARRALTEENVMTAYTPGIAPERPDVPARAASLVPQSSHTADTFSTGLDDGVSWHPQDTAGIEDLEPPPLQRGMLDEVVDIRRNIEERMLTLNDSGEGIVDHGTDFALPFETVAAPSSVQSDVGSDGIQRVDFLSEQSPVGGDSAIIADDAFVFSDPSYGPRQLIDGDNTPNSINASNTTIESSDDSWETLDVDQNRGPRIGDDAEDDGGQQDVIEIGPQDTVEPSSSANDQTENDVVPDTLFGHVTQWMWHTDEQTRVESRVAQAAAAAAAAAANEEGAVHIHDGGHRQQANDNNAVNPAQEPANPPAHEPNIQFGVDLNDPNAADDAEDLEGILELIGMEGPFTGMIQNIIFSVFLITLTLSASVWCPYIWGKIAILVVSNPIGVFIKAPLLFISKCGNILIDLLLFVGSMTLYGLSNLTKIIKIVLAPILPSLAARIRVATVDQWSYGISQTSGTRLEKALAGTFLGLRPDLPTFSMQSHHALRVFRHAFGDAISAVYTDIFDTVVNIIDSWNTYGLLGLPMFLFKEAVTFPGASLTATKRIAAWWRILVDDLKLRPLSEISDHEFALVEWTPEDKVLATIVGYAFFAVAGFAYLKIAHALLGLRKDEKVDGILADSLRQAGGVLKVIVIIGIEMIVFPLYCGSLLDCALLPLFNNATFQSRLNFLLNAPVTCLFVHWFVGTCYMFHFALFVSMCRKIMRKGVLYFIRDPDDPTFHPVRDVLERPVATQLRKIAFSALVYGGLVILCLGGVVWTISGISGILPIHWATSEPRLAFPVDIVFYNFMLPFILKRAEPSKRISTMYQWWFQQCARSLRLTHFLFGTEQDDEKTKSQPFWRRGLAKQSGIQTILTDGNSAVTSPEYVQRQYDGRYVRVPAADSVRIPKGTKVFVEVNEKNERIDGQPDHDKGLHGKSDERFVKIYIPPHFKKRVALFVFLVWLFTATTGAAFTVLPLLVGRQLIHLVTASSSPPNDLYAFTVGLHSCGVLAFTGYMGFTRKNKLRSRAVEAFTNTKESLPRLYRTLRRVLGIVYLFVVTFIVLPMAVSLLTELYIHMPIYSYFAANIDQISIPNSDTATTVSINPTIFVLQTWTLGLLYLRLALRFAINFPDGQNRPSIALRAITRNGYLNPDIALASRALVLPALTICIVLLTAPLVLARIIIIFTGTSKPTEKLEIYRYSYPVVFGMAAAVYLAVGIQHKVEGWRVKVRDEVYLVGERLHNFADSDNVKDKKQAAVKAQFDDGKGKEKAVEMETGIDAGEGSSNDVLIPDLENSRVTGHEFAKSDTTAVASGSLVE